MNQRKIIDLLDTIRECDENIENCISIKKECVKELQLLCLHENVIELPGITYDGIAKIYARRFCKICKLEESARNFNGHFNKLTKAHYIINNINSSVAIAEYIETKDES